MAPLHTDDPALDPSWPPREWYAEVGFICGLEVHQQLLTRRKLFCRCPAGIYTEEHDARIMRHMRPTLSELGVYDGTALMEFRTRKRIIYLLDRRVVCTYEMDDTPPMLVDQDAIDVAIEQCLMLGCDIVDEVHIARKQYLDGSIPTGFQRTAVVGVGGSLPFRGRQLDIIQVTVEEDSCREVRDAGHLIVWRADRLGTPLIETVTEPQLLLPDEVEDAILLVGRVCRSTGHVRTGIGASRQDVNVSVRGGTRVEIKGVSRAWWAPGLVRGEAIRQVRLLELKDKLAAAGITDEASVRVRRVDVADQPACGLLTSAGFARWCEQAGYRPELELGDGPFGVSAVVLEGVGELLQHPTQPGLTFADELRGRVRVIAGLDQPPVLLADGDDDRWAPGAAQALAGVRAELGLGEREALVLVWGPEADRQTAFEEIRTRLIDATQGIPAETRQPFPDGSTCFERILPGPDRMYPDTDSPPTRVERDRVERLRAGLPALPWEREARYGEAGVSTEVARWLIRRGGARLVDRLAPAGCEPARLRRAAVLVGERFKAWQREGLAPEAVADEAWQAVFDALDARPEVRDVLGRLGRALCASEGADRARAEALIAELAPGAAAAPADWQQRVAASVAARHREYRRIDRDGRRRLHVGQALRELGGRVPAAEVIACVERALEGS